MSGVEIVEMGAAVEAVSRGYAAKFEIDRTDVWFALKLQEEVGELTKAFVNLKGMGRGRGHSDQEKLEAFAGECADVLAHLLLLARNEGIDLNKAVSDKWLKWA